MTTAASSSLPSASAWSFTPSVRTSCDAPTWMFSRDVAMTEPSNPLQLLASPSNSGSCAPRGMCWESGGGGGCLRTAGMR